jgi:hypothetical protein
MNLPDAPIAHEGFFATHFFTFIHTFACGLYALHGIDTDHALVRHVATFEGEGCSVPLRINQLLDSNTFFRPTRLSAMPETTMKLGVSRQTVWQRVKRGELEALLVIRGRRKGLRIRVVDDHPNLFESTS